MSWSTSELRVRLAPLNRFKPSSKIFYWPFQGGTSFVDFLCFCSVLCLLCFVRVCLYVLRGHLLGKGWPLGSRLWCLLWVCHFPIGILGQVWYLIVSIPDLCNLTYSCWFCYHLIQIEVFRCVQQLMYHGAIWGILTNTFILPVDIPQIEVTNVFALISSSRSVCKSSDDYDMTVRLCWFRLSLHCPLMR